MDLRKEMAKDMRTVPWILGATAHMGNNNRWAREGGVIDEILVENTYRNPEGNPLIFDTILLEKVFDEPALAEDGSTVKEVGPGEWAHPFSHLMLQQEIPEIAVKLDASSHFLRQPTIRSRRALCLQSVS